MTTAPPPAHPQPQRPPTLVAALYCFVPVPDPAGLQGRLRAVAADAELLGTLLVAPEGVNGTVSGTPEGVARLRAALDAEGIGPLEYKESWHHEPPFGRLRVRLKREIVSFGPPVEPRRAVGHYLDPQAWHDLLAEEDVVVVDTRNRYEVRAGTFAGAVDPGTETFREFPEWAAAHLKKDQRIAMFCTGGIRCEKATSYLVAQGYREVYHLKGGILAYLEHMPEEGSRWEGECFVFDGRVTVGHGLQSGAGHACHACGWPLNAEELQHAAYEVGVSCPHCAASTTEAQKAGYRERQRQLEREGRA